MPLRSVLGASVRRPDVTFRKSDGRISVTAGVASRLGIKCGDSIDIIADDYECHLAVRTHSPAGRYKAVCRPTNRGKHRCRNFRAYSREICDYVCARFGSEVVQLSAGDITEHPLHGRLVTLINRNLYGHQSSITVDNAI